jgi:hypothetical protein
MWIPFNEMPERARIWVYPCSRALTDAEVHDVNIRIAAFVKDWLSHQRVVEGSGMVLNHRFIVLTADEVNVDVSGCSIDSSVRFIKDIEKTFGIQCFERTHLYFLNEGGTVDTVDFRDIKDAWEKGTLHEGTLIFNLQASCVEDLKANWMIPILRSMYSRFLPIAQES